ncbi:MAG: 6-carboxytetrahydropterin synthase QueD [Deltaproteobacteria bacterium GWA2_54_12]|nr:MAG: 6-carboxytetrahydropterin synthase QueD [Deltaproteobacteria bacterium GWA2_54_12]
MYELTVIANFSSAHCIRGYEGACENLHGHNWKVEVTVRAKGLDHLGMVMDFKAIKTRTREVVDRLDHRYLNEVKPFDTVNATAENIAMYIYRELAASIGSGVSVARVKVWESDTAAAAYFEEGD